MQQYVQATQGCIDAVSSASASSTSHMTVVPSELVFHHKPSSPSSVSFASSQSVAITNYTGEKLRYACDEKEHNVVLVIYLAQQAKSKTKECMPLKNMSFLI